MSIYHNNFTDLDEQKTFSLKLLIFSYQLVLTYVLGTQKNRLIVTVLLSTHNIRFGLKIRELIFWYTLLSKVLNLISLLVPYRCSHRTGE